MKYIKDLIWPKLEPASSSELLSRWKDVERDLENVRRANWSVCAPDALEEARRLVDKEFARKNTADTKAGMFLAAVFALAPLMAAAAGGAWDPRGGLAKSIVLVIVSIIATGYVWRAGLWAFKALGVISMHRIDAIDLANIWKSGGVVRAPLIQEMLISVIKNRDAVNEKVSCTIMAQEFLIRAIIAIGIVTAINMTWGPLEYLYKYIFFDPDLHKSVGGLFFWI